MKFIVKLSYNTHAGTIDDLLELVKQKKNEKGLPYDPPLLQAYVFGIRAVSEVFSDESDKKAISEVLSESIAESIANTELADKDLERHTSAYLDELNKGNRVILIAHSQGNMFANASILSLQSKWGQNIGMIGVATPASVIHNNSKYYTAYDDVVINEFRAYDDVLPANIDNEVNFAGAFDYRDALNHAFIASYFQENLPSRAAIDKELIHIVETLQFPIPVVSPIYIDGTLGNSISNLLEIECICDFDLDGYYATACGGDDCDDFDEERYPGNTEICDTKDNDCDEEIDEELSTDNDGDKHYAEGSCSSPADDCNDNDVSIYPGATDIPNDGIDQDCDGEDLKIEYAVWIHEDSRTCCPGNFGGVAPYQYHGTEKDQADQGAIILATFSSQNEMTDWTCNRTVHIAYNWISNWSEIDGYIVTNLPCEANAPFEP
jgi:hypothetical protein